LTDEKTEVKRYCRSLDGSIENKEVNKTKNLILSARKDTKAGRGRVSDDLDCYLAWIVGKEFILLNNYWTLC
jgi:hypothetical protein